MNLASISHFPHYKRRELNWAGGPQPWQKTAVIVGGGLKHECAWVPSQIFIGPGWSWDGVLRAPRTSNVYQVFRISELSQPLGLQFRWFPLWLQPESPNLSLHVPSQPGDLFPLGTCLASLWGSQSMLGSVLAQGTSLTQQELVPRQEI